MFKHFLLKYEKTTSTLGPQSATKGLWSGKVIEAAEDRIHIDYLWLETFPDTSFNHGIPKSYYTPIPCPLYTLSLPEAFIFTPLKILSCNKAKTLLKLLVPGLSMASSLLKLIAFSSVFLLLHLPQQHSLAQEVGACIVSTSSLFWRLQRKLGERRRNGLWCASETWTLEQRQARELNRFHLAYLIKLLKIIQQSRIRFLTLRCTLETQLPSTEPLQLHWGWWCWISNLH